MALCPFLEWEVNEKSVTFALGVPNSIRKHSFDDVLALQKKVMKADVSSLWSRCGHSSLEFNCVVCGEGVRLPNGYSASCIGISSPPHSSSSFSVTGEVICDKCIDKALDGLLPVEKEWLSSTWMKIASFGQHAEEIEEILLLLRVYDCIAKQSEQTVTIPEEFIKSEKLCREFHLETPYALENFLTHAKMPKSEWWSWTPARTPPVDFSAHTTDTAWHGVYVLRKEGILTKEGAHVYSRMRTRLFILDNERLSYSARTKVKDSLVYEEKGSILLSEIDSVSGGKEAKRGSILNIHTGSRMYKIFPSEEVRNVYPWLVDVASFCMYTASLPACDESRVESFLKQGANPNVGLYDHDIDPPLVNLVLGKFKVASELITHGADPCCLLRRSVISRNGAVDIIYPFLLQNLSIILDVQGDDKDRKTILHYVAELGGNVNASGDVDALKTREIDLNATDGFQLTPLLIAVRHGRVELAEQLLEHGASAFIPDSTGTTPAHEIIDRGLTSLFQYVFSNKSSIDVDCSVRDRMNRTLLHCLVSTGHITNERMEMLCDADVDTNAQDCLGMTAAMTLILAHGIKLYPPLESLCLSQLRLLVEYDADLLIPTTFSYENVLHVLVKCPHLQDVLEYVLDVCPASSVSVNRDGNTPLLRALISHNMRAAVSIIEKTREYCGRYIDATNIRGDSALHVCSIYGYRDVIKLLLENGASSALWNAEGMCPVHIICRRGDYESLRVFIENGGKVNVREEAESVEPVHIAVKSSNTEILKLLVDCGVNCASPLAKSRKNALHLIAESNAGPAMYDIIKECADIGLNAVDSWRNTPLHYAYAVENEMLCSKLIKDGAVCDVWNKFGRTPIQLKGRGLSACTGDRFMDGDVESSNGISSSAFSSREIISSYETYDGEEASYDQTESGLLESETAEDLSVATPSGKEEEESSEEFVVVPRESESILEKKYLESDDVLPCRGYNEIETVESTPSVHSDENVFPDARGYEERPLEDNSLSEHTESSDVLDEDTEIPQFDEDDTDDSDDQINT